MTTYVGALRGKAAATAVASRLPHFEVSFADIPGVNPEEFEPEIVRLESTKYNMRILGATVATSESGQNVGAFGLLYSPYIEQETPVERKIEGPGEVRISPLHNLTPGEYAVVLRSLLKQKKFSGDAVTRNDGEGVLFNSAWSFSVK